MSERLHYDMPVKWNGDGWYILYHRIPSWKTAYEKCETMEQMNFAGKQKRHVVYLTRFNTKSMEEVENE